MWCFPWPLCGTEPSLREASLQAELRKRRLGQRLSLVPAAFGSDSGAAAGSAPAVPQQPGPRLSMGQAPAARGVGGNPRLSLCRLLPAEPGPRRFPALLLGWFPDSLREWIDYHIDNAATAAAPQLPDLILHWDRAEEQELAQGWRRGLRSAPWLRPRGTEELLALSWSRSSAPRSTLQCRVRTGCRRGSKEGRALRHPRSASRCSGCTS